MCPGIAASALATIAVTHAAISFIVCDQPSPWRAFQHTNVVAYKCSCTTTPVAPVRLATQKRSKINRTALQPIATRFCRVQTQINCFPEVLKPKSHYELAAESAALPPAQLPQLQLRSS